MVDLGSSCCGATKRIWLWTMRLRVPPLALLSGLRIWHCCGVSCKRGLDLALLWRWHRPTAILSIRPLAWESPYATGSALKRPKKKKNNNNNYSWFTMFCQFPMYCKMTQWYIYIYTYIYYILSIMFHCKWLI